MEEELKEATPGERTYFKQTYYVLIDNKLIRFDVSKISSTFNCPTSGLSDLDV